ncbi:MAG: hypothetical protein KF789_12510, partial [Bdellovibrionaceae bacterium]|nr:hypothetical protein [Pseudobdellovibrionaceae bacterium]
RHALAKRKEIDFEELQNDTIILHHKREAEEFHERISKLIQGLKKRPRIYIKADAENCAILVAVGKGVALTIAGAQRLAPEGTRFVPLKEMFLPVSIFWKEGEQDPTLQTFLSAVIENRSLRKSKTHCLDLSAKTP